MWVSGGRGGGFHVEHIKTFAVEKIFNKEKYFKGFSETTEP